MIDNDMQHIIFKRMQGRGPRCCYSQPDLISS